MAIESGKIRRTAILLIVVTGLIPIILYMLLYGRVPTVTAQEARETLQTTDSSSVLIDTRHPEDFQAEHIEGAINWPFKKILALESIDEAPRQFKNKTLYLVCESGLESALSVGKLQNLSPVEAYNIKGGMQDWVGASKSPCQLSFCTLKTASGEMKGFPFRRASFFEQLMACVAAFGAKPLYMILSLVFAFLMRRLKAADMVALRWGFIAFFVGEGFCALNYLFFSEDSYLIEYLHSFGMVVAFGFTTYALFEGFDQRIIKYSGADNKCAALGLCDACVKYADVPCGFRQIFKWLIPSFAVLSFIPLLASMHANSYNTDIFGTLYNYSHPVLFQLFEIRYAPVVAIVLFSGAFYIMWRNENDPVPWAKILFSAGMGFFGFSMFRLIFFGLYRDNLVWYVCWEEFTELLYIVFAGIVLWIFRARLFSEKAV